MKTPLPWIKNWVKELFKDDNVLSSDKYIDVLTKQFHDKIAENEFKAAKALADRLYGAKS